MRPGILLVRIPQCGGYDPAMQPEAATPPTNGVIRLVCVDDSSLLVSAWQRLFSLQPDIRVVATAESADGLLDLVRECKPHVVMIDMTMRGRDPLDAIVELSTARPEARVLVFSGMSDQGLVEKCLTAGAWGFIGKHSDPPKVIEAVRAVASGRVVVPAPGEG